MNESKIKRIWEENKRFFLVAGAGLAVFLGLNAWISSYLAGADATLRKASELAEQSRKLKQELKGGYWEVRGRIDDYAELEKRLLGDLAVAPLSEASRLDQNALLVEFNESIEKVWEDALKIANRQGVELPERLSPDDFGYEPSDDLTAFQRYYKYLAIIRRAMNAILEADVRELGQPELIAEDVHAIENNPERGLLLRVVRFSTLASYDTYVRLLKSVQTPGDFLQVQILSLAVPKGGDGSLLRADMIFGTCELTTVEPRARAGTRVQFTGD